MRWPLSSRCALKTSSKPRRRELPFPRLGAEWLEDRFAPSVSRFAIGVVESPTVHLRIYGSNGAQVGDIDVTGLAGKGSPSYATADVTGDGTDDIIVGSGAGISGTIQVFDGVTFRSTFSATPFGAFNGGVNVSAGDITGDGIAELFASPDLGGGPRVIGYNGGDFHGILNFLALESTFRGGVKTAVGDVNRDGHPDLIVGASGGGGPRVAVFNGATLGGTPERLVSDFFAFESTSRTGVNVAAGDVNGDGYADIAVGAGAGGGPRVVVISGRELLDSVAGAVDGPIANFFSGDATLRTGVIVHARDLNSDAKADLTTGSYIGDGGGISSYDATGLLNGTLSVLFNLTETIADGTALHGLTDITVTPVPPADPSSLVTLHLNPLDINLLGVEISTSPITVTVSAQEGDGLLLGNALTIASHIINLPQVSDALNNVLGNVVDLLNSASLSITDAVAGGSLSDAAVGELPVLDAFVAPVHLSLLGAIVDTSPIHLTITSHSGPGLVLGNALTALANLFNPPLPDQLDVAAINTALESLVDDLNSMIPTIPATFSPPPPIPDGSDRILQLVVAPLDVDLLGLNLQTSQINVNADAHAGDGLLLGNVLTTLLNTLDATPDELTRLSDNINTLLAKVIGVLNAADLTLGDGALGTLDQIIQDLALPTLVTPTSPASQQILNLMIASTDGTSPPVDVNLLGLEITTSNIEASLTATTGDGRILGNLVYNVSHLLDPGGTLNLLGILGQLGI